MKLLIIRHGDPDYSIDSLTETGWIEADVLSEKLTRLDVKAFYCSPLGRAKDTAKATLRKMGREATVLPWLQEFGPVNVVKPNRPEGGICWDWLPQDWTAEPLFYDKDRWFDAPAFRAAGVQAEAEKVYAGFDQLLAEHGYVREGKLYRAEKANEDTLVLFCHFGLECVLLGHLLGISPVVLWHGACAAPTSVTTVVTEERREGIAAFRMSSFGDISHLYAAGREPSFAARFCETFGSDQRHD